ncbi:MAG: hypothetical protein IIX96_01830, partial [Clostridia bacterium]|nr:hypothetical protein [Clostridia bacterium]
MSGLSTLIRLDREFESFVSTLQSSYRKEEAPPIAVNGLSGGAENSFLAEAVIESRRLSTSPALILTSQDDEAAKLTEALISLGIRARHYQHRDLIFNNIRASHDTERARLSVLLSLLDGAAECIVTTPMAAATATIPPALLRSRSVCLTVGDEIDISELISRLLSMGYSEGELVEGVGQFSHRGGIVDVFAGGAQRPVRIEFFGDEVDRMVYFDPLTQRSEEVCDVLSLFPASEVPIDAAARERVKAQVTALLSAAKADEARARLTSELNMIDGMMALDFRDKYLGAVFGEFTTLFDYFAARTVVFTVGTSSVKRSFDEFPLSLTESVKRLFTSGLISDVRGYALDKSEFSARLSSHLSVHINS